MKQMVLFTLLMMKSSELTLFFMPSCAPVPNFGSLQHILGFFGVHDLATMRQN
jgi:hypothetical protein